MLFISLFWFLISAYHYVSWWCRTFIWSDGTKVEHAGESWRLAGQSRRSSASLKILQHIRKLNAMTFWKEFMKEISLPVGWNLSPPAMELLVCHIFKIPTSIIKYVQGQWRYFYYFFILFFLTCLCFFFDYRIHKIFGTLLHAAYH